MLDQTSALNPNFPALPLTDDEWDLIAYLMNNIELKALQLTFVNPDKVGVVIYTNFSRYLDIRISTLWDI